jgi:hypothetical protein
MEGPDFERILDELCSRLNARLKEGKLPASSKEFENLVRDHLAQLPVELGIVVDFQPHPHVFPDIVLPPFGIEVKFSLNDTWRSVANSVFESSRHPDIEEIYLVFGKMGGTPEVRWAPYGESVVHVRTSHVPRFEVEIAGSRSLFETMNLTYEDFASLPEEEKMEHIRAYARSRLKSGERLWWLENREESEHSLPIQARLFKSLEDEEKRKLRAEAALLCPSIVGSSRQRTKYDDAALYLLTYHGVLAPQMRDLFSAGSVALRGNATRGGKYIARSLRDIETEMLSAAQYLDDRLFEDYWGEIVPQEDRIAWWLSEADRCASDWKPSELLFLGNR